MKALLKLPAALALLFALILSSCIAYVPDGAETGDPAGTGETGNYTDAPDTGDPEDVLPGSFSIDTDNGTVTSEGRVYTISSEGVYRLSGVLEDGQIIVDAEDGTVTLELAGTGISCGTGAPVCAFIAGKLKIKALQGTSNRISDERPKRTAESDSSPAGAVYAACDIEFTGEGELSISASFNNGIHSKDDIKISGIRLSVKAENNAVKGNDSVTIDSGDLKLVSLHGNGIKTENTGVSQKGRQRGNVGISGGSLEIFSACDGIDAAYDFIMSGDQTAVSVMTHSYSEFTPKDAMNTSKTGFGLVKSSDSAKGIKADNMISISGGTVKIRSMDDGLHANGAVKLENGETSTGDIEISGGSFTIVCADDGMHADGTLLITGGSIDVTESHEGLEGHNVTVEDGEIRIYATDDGINATSSGQTGRDGLITVRGGRLFVEVEGRDVDGMDANGNYSQTGGFVVVSNPSANSMGTAAAVDTDGNVSVTGGTIIALGTVPGSSGGGPGGKGPGRPGGGRFGMGGMGSGSLLPAGHVTFSGTLEAGEHEFAFGDISAKFSLKNRVTGGWIWSEGITPDGFTLR